MKQVEQFITFPEYWEICKTYEHNAMRGLNKKAAKPVGGLADVIDDFDLIILDSWGVLHDTSPEAYPQAKAALEMIREKNKKVVVLSNDANASKAGRLSSYEQKGLYFEVSELFNGLDMLSTALKQYPKVRHWGGVYGSGLDLETAHQHCPELVNITEDFKLIDAVEGIILFTALVWNDALEEAVCNSLAHLPRPVIVANPDICAPHGEKLQVTPGYAADRILHNVGGDVTYVGKPFTIAFDTVCKSFPDINRDRILMVGDTLHTDIMGANNFGLKTLLVEKGVYKNSDVPSLCAESGIAPDFISEYI